MKLIDQFTALETLHASFCRLTLEACKLQAVKPQIPKRHGDDYSANLQLHTYSLQWLKVLELKFYYLNSFSTW